MYGKNLVICDCEEQYAKNLLQVLSHVHQTETSLYLFYTIQELKKFSEQKRIDCLLISSDYEQAQREEIPAEKKYVLVREKQPLAEGEIGIFRYQSAENIWRKMQQKKEKKRSVVRMDPQSTPRHEKREEARIYIRQETINESKTMANVNGRLIGVYSPIHRIGKTKFALELGKKLAEKGPVLYLNLETYSGGEGYFPEQQKENLGDLIYYSRQEQLNLGMRISMMAGQLGKLDYIEPMCFLQDLKGVSQEEWIGLLQQILHQCIYKKIILDLGDSVNGLFEILAFCDVVYTPYIEDRISRMKLIQYTENLRKTGMDGIIEKTIQKKMQGNRDVRTVPARRKGVEETR